MQEFELRLIIWEVFNSKKALESQKEQSQKQIRKSFRTKHFTMLSYFYYKLSINPKHDFKLMVHLYYYYYYYYYWASEASPTLGCSIEISCDIYMYICVSVMVQKA